jgi:hypothetical protein
MSTESDVFNSAVPRRLQIGLLRAVIDGCRAAHDEAKRVAKEWFHDAIPPLRRLKVEPLIHGLVLPKGFTSSVRRTPSSHYTKIESDIVVVTGVTRSFHRSWVRPDPYRRTLARDAQMFLRGLEREDTNSYGSRLFALLMYGGTHKERMPTLASIVFPTRSGFLAPGTINLLETFSDVVASYRSAPEAGVKLRIVEKAEDEDA